MGFTQITFLFIFLPICILIYLGEYKFSGKNLKVCNAVLVCEGIVFYWWAEPRLLVFFVSLTVLMHILGAGIYKARSNDEKNLLLIFGIIVFALLPVIFRYLPAIKMMDADDQPVIMPLFAAMLVPVGIAFFVLGAISYITDIYTGKARPGSMMDSFLFAMLFPKAVCGPVVLWRDFRPQTHKRKTSLNNVSNGIRRIIIGYAKKLIIADTFAVQIALIDTKMTTNSTDSITVWIMGLLYFFRIYYDFSGYSDIAIGLCNIFGFDIGENFDRPYLSGSLTDFWRRWHISLGRWFREYIYIPLGGSRKGNVYINILITFLIAALWHGWKLNILLWGVLNGLIVIAEKAISKKARHRKKANVAGIFLTVILMYFGWMLFMAPDIAAAGTIFKALFISPGGAVPNFTWQFFMTKRIIVFLVIAAAGAFGVFHKIGELIRIGLGTAAYDITEKILLLVLFAIDIMFVLGASYIPFIYSLIP